MINSFADLPIINQLACMMFDGQIQIKDYYIVRNGGANSFTLYSALNNACVIEVATAKQIADYIEFVYAKQ